ncbi:MAG: alpha-ketoglutarate-dependent dioxygenase AlkB [Polyangiaceae bacterium]
MLDVRYLPGFVPDPAALLARVRQELQWESRMRARQTVSYGLAYNYSGMVYPDVPMPGFLAELAQAVERVVGHPITNCLGNLYETGESTMGFHSDSAVGLGPETSTSIVSLGAVRSLTFRLKASREHTRAVALEPGSLLVMAPAVQDLWMHAVLPSAETSPRVSLTFRHVLGRGANGELRAS